MLVNPRPITLGTARAVNTHLDRWASHQLRDPDQWQRVLEVTRDWSDYSARNQLLLASYPATGPVAGIETWRLVPASDTGTCAVRSGEHAFPVRVPVTTTATEPDPHLGGTRPTAAAVAGWEWRGVFCLEQLARRPDPATLTHPGVPAAMDNDALRVAAVATARRTLKGRLPDAGDPAAVLTAAAGRMPRTAKRPAPSGPLAEQAAWLALDRIGGAEGAPRRFDPSRLAERERWEAMLDVLDTDRRLTAALGRHLQLDLLASPLPRMEVDDDRGVPATRRNRLPRASLEQLPVGRWVEVGPYTPDEWAARGEDANGKGSYLRLNSTAYLVIVERGDRATWRLEDTRAKVGAGRLDGGDDATLAAARKAALATLSSRYPQLAPNTADHAAPAPAGARTGWEAIDGQAGTLRHVHHGRVASYVIPAGDHWVPLVQRGPTEPPEAVSAAVISREEAVATAEAAGRRALREATLVARVDFDTAITSLAAAPTYTRAQLVEHVSPRLATPEQAALAGNPTPAELAELLGAAGVSVTTIVTVLHAEDVPAHQVGPLLPLLGISPSDAIGELHQRWGIGRVEAAELVDASATEMRAAGCSAVEIIRARPREVLATLPTQPDLWGLAGGTLATTGHRPDDITGFLTSHAPNPDCFAVGLTAAIEDPTEGMTLATRHGVAPEVLTALSERYGLSPADTASALAAAYAAPVVAVAVVHQRCDLDPVLTTQVARSALGLRTDSIVTALVEREPLDPSTVRQLRAAAPLSHDRQALIAAHRSATGGVASGPRPETRQLLAGLPEPDPHDTTTGRDALLASLPRPDMPTGADSLESLPRPDPSLTLTEIDR